MELVLKGNNVYRNGTVSLFDDNEGVIERDIIEYKGTTDDKYHRVTKLDRIDLLAYKYYSPRVEDASKYWWIIADANNIENPLDLSEYVGKEILIPSILNVLLELQQ